MGKPGLWNNSLSVMRGNLLVLTMTRMLGMFGRSMAYPYASLYILALGGNPEQIGLVNSLSPLAGLLVFPIGGYLADHRGRVRLIGLTGIAAGLVYSVYVAAPTWHWLLIGALLRGFTMISFPPNSAVVADSLAPKDRGRGIALMNSLSSAPVFLAPLAAGALLQALGVDPGMRYLYGTLAAASFLGGLLNLRYLRETTQPTGERFRWTDIPAILRRTYCDAPEMLRRLPRATMALGAVVVLGFVGNAIAGPFWVVYAIEHIGLTEAQWGSVLLVEGGLRSAAYIPAGMLVDRWGRARCMRIALGIALVTVPLFVWASAFWMVLPIRMCVAVANALFAPSSMALMADTIPRALRGRAMAALGRGAVMLGSTGGGLGGPSLGYLVTLPAMAASYLGGFLYAFSAELPWFVAFGALLGCLALTAVFVRDPRRAQA